MISTEELGKMLLNIRHCKLKPQDYRSLLKASHNAFPPQWGNPKEDDERMGIALSVLEHFINKNTREYPDDDREPYREAYEFYSELSRDFQTFYREVILCRMEGSY